MVVGVLGATCHARMEAASPAGPAATRPPLLAVPDAYQGLSIDVAALSATSPAEFGVALRTSCALWRDEGVRGVWMQIPLDRSDLVPVAVSTGFTYHHASASVLTLIRWLPDTPSTIPAGPSTQIGVGAFVLNARNEVLMVKERTGPAAKYGIWKVPTGLIEPGEDLVAACAREVLEETGVRTSLDGAVITSIRHAHPTVAGGVSDVFVMISLRLDASPEAEELRVQESEIAEAKWMPLDELKSLKYYAPGGMLYEMVLAAQVEKRSGFAGVKQSNGLRPGSSFVYRAHVDAQ